MCVNSSSVFQEDYRALYICKKGTVILVGVVLKSKARNTRGITLSSFFFSSFFYPNNEKSQDHLLSSE